MEVRCCWKFFINIHSFHWHAFFTHIINQYQNSPCFPDIHNTAFHKSFNNLCWYHICILNHMWYNIICIMNHICIWKGFCWPITTISISFERSRLNILINKYLKIYKQFRFLILSKFFVYLYSVLKTLIVFANKGPLKSNFKPLVFFRSVIDLKAYKAFSLKSY